MIVLKFGGSSVDSTAAIARVVGIIRERLPRRPVVVVSAMAKTTRRLDAAAAAAAAGDRAAALAVLDELREYHLREAAPAVGSEGRARLDAALDATFADLHARVEELLAGHPLTPRLSDAVAAQGEILSSAILALALAYGGVPSEHVDCRRVIVTDDQFCRARPRYDLTDARLRTAMLPALARGAVPVVGGYVGATAEGVTTTLGKEGSDFSAAIVGAALGADEVQIWTDVDGIQTADPQVVPDARRVRTLSFGEALELACSGSKKPHPGTLEPASRGGVPIRILSSLHPEAEGTLIGRRAEGAPPGVKSIAWRPNASLLALTAAPHAGNGFLPGLAEVAERLRPALLVCHAEEAGARLGVRSADRLEEIHEALARVGTVEVAPGRAVVSIVSDDLGTSPELVQRTLAAAGADARFVLRGVASPAVRLLVDEAEAEAVVARLHERLFAGDPEEAVP